MKISMKIFSCMGSHLYEWNNSDDDVSCFKVTSKLWRKITFFIGFSSTVLYYCFLIWRLIQYSNQLESDPSFPDIVWLWIWIILTTWAIVSFYNGWTKKREVVAHFKGVTLLMKQLEREHPTVKMKSVIWKFNVMDVHFIVVIFIIFNYVGAVSIMFFVVPGRPQYIYSLLSPSKISRIDAAFLLFLGFEIYAKASQVCMMAMQEFSIFPVLLPTDFWLDYCKKAEHNIIPTWKKVEILRKFHVLITYYNYASVQLLTPVISVFIPVGISVSCFFAVIRFHSFLPIFEYLPFPVLSNNGMVVLLVTLLPATAIYEGSIKLCQKIRTEGNMSMNKVLRKRVATLHPFGVRIGPIGKIRKIAILLMYHFIANNIFTLLVTFPPENVIP
ncbi:hypothetical protein Fcan01_20683 [Folsomia candida]|uniref:Uncharacterized protein n=2 Tax=Folsomia candida TaxID=158441 RepID=A0A226DJ24_FOLCA|nr:hypothetical protein Fcan01_20683 [Folsomia candida]